MYKLLLIIISTIVGFGAFAPATAHAQAGSGGCIPNGGCFSESANNYNGQNGGYYSYNNGMPYVVYVKPPNRVKIKTAVIKGVPYQDCGEEIGVVALPSGKTCLDYRRDATPAPTRDDTAYTETPPRALGRPLRAGEGPADSGLISADAARAAYDDKNIVIVSTWNSGGYLFTEKMDRTTGRHFTTRE